MSQQFTLICVDVVADGPCPGLYSIISIGAARVERSVNHLFFEQLAPISDKFVHTSLQRAAITRAIHENYPAPGPAMIKFGEWLRAAGKNPVFVSANAFHDWQFINYYFHLFCDKNPFGEDGRKIGDIYCGMVKDLQQTTGWKLLSATRGNGHPALRAKAVAEAMIGLADKGLKF